MEGRDQGELTRSSEVGRLVADVLAAGLFGALLAAGIGWTLQAVGRAGPLGPVAFRAFLLAGGWLKLPLACAALGALRSVVRARSRKVRVAGAVTAIVLSGLSVVLVIVPSPGVERVPRTPLSKSRAMLRWSYESPAAVLRIVHMSHDPDPRVRELAMLAMGDNVVVAAFERVAPAEGKAPRAGERASRSSDPAVRDSLRTRLLEAMVADTSEGVRGEAARAVWGSPRTFGDQPAAAETLAAMLDRAGRPGALERLSWLALDAAAGRSQPTLTAAVARFAATTGDTALARVARLALAPSSHDDSTAREAGRSGAASGIRDPR